MDDFESEQVIGEFFYNLSNSQEKLDSDYTDVSRDDIWDLNDDNDW